MSDLGKALEVYIKGLFIFGIIIGGVGFGLLSCVSSYVHNHVTIEWR